MLCIGMSGMAMGPSTGTYVIFGETGMGMGGGRMGQMGRMPFEDGTQDSQASGSSTQEVQTEQTSSKASDSGTREAQPSENSGQTSGSSISISKGSKIVIKDASGKVIAETTAQKNANSVMFASGDLTSGSEYTLYIDGKEAGTATAAEGTGMSGGMAGQPGENGGEMQRPDRMNGNGGEMQMPGEMNGNGGEMQRPDQMNENGGGTQTPDQNKDNSSQAETKDQAETETK